MQIYLGARQRIRAANEQGEMIMAWRLDIAARHWRRTGANFIVALIFFAACAVAAGHAAAENIKIGAVRAASNSPLYIAQERGYFAAEGVPAELVFFDAAQPVAVATVAGAIDFGVGLSAG